MNFKKKFGEEIAHPIRYYPRLANFLGSPKEGLFVSQFGYWEGKQRDEEGGFIYKKQEEIKAETGLKRSSQETVRRSLINKGYLIEKRGKLAGTLHFKILWDVIVDDFIEWAGTVDYDNEF
jgi:hypothetical protein